MSGQNIKVTIESEQSYWNDLMSGLESYLNRPFSISDTETCRIRAAVTHFKTKLTNALISNPETKEDMREAYHDSFTA